MADLTNTKGDSFTDLVLNALKGAVFAVLVGSAVGVLAAFLVRRCLEAGWAGPAGLRLTSPTLPFLTYAPILAYVQLPLGEAVFAFNLTCATVLLSVILHGVTREPIARWFARNPRPAAPTTPSR